MTDQAADPSGRTEAAHSTRDRLRKQPVSRVAVAIGISLLVVFGGLTRLVFALDSNSTPIPTKAEPLTGAQASPVEDLPVPEQAGGQTGNVTSVYIVPANVTAVKAWYSRHLHAGQPWHGWSWVNTSTDACDSYVAGNTYMWQWQRPGTILSIAISPYVNNRHFAAVVISVSQQQEPFCTSG